MARAAALIGGRVGWQRFTLGRLARRSRRRPFSIVGCRRVSPLGVEALCARVIHHARAARSSTRSPAARTSPRAFAHAPGSAPGRRTASGRSGARPGCVRCPSCGGPGWPTAPSVPPGARGGVAALGTARLLVICRCGRARRALSSRGCPAPVLAVAPVLGCQRVGRALGVARRQLEESSDTSLARVQQRLFVEGRRPPRHSATTCLLISAPGEPRVRGDCPAGAAGSGNAASRSTGWPWLLRAPASTGRCSRRRSRRAGIPGHRFGTLGRILPAGHFSRSWLAPRTASRAAVRRILSLGEVPQAVSGGRQLLPPGRPVGPRTPS